ncbi:neugrin [Nerophis lumbriciformis]|uniref:neugrin n=1 Tax=Nerophis lumbriciformis TaxID=546530 RepID=UPI002AE0441B|nr:neugrin-like [Nerophis lumbriciformis]
MAGRLPVLSMLASLGIRTVASPSVGRHRVALMFVRFSSRSGRKTWTEQSGGHTHFHQEDDRDCMMEDVEDKLEALLKEREKNRNATKYNIIKRKMRPPGAPERKLSWQAIEQIKFLKQEQPDEWSVKHLAEGFSVSPDEIVRVLKSKFIPDPARKLKQDAKAMTRLNPQVLPSGSGAEQSRLKLHRGRTADALLPSGSQENSLVPVAAHTLIGGNTNSDNKSLAVASAPVTAPSRFNSASNKDATEKTTAGDNSSHPAEEEEENWDGKVLSEEQIAQIWEMKKPAPAVQVGKDFFDGEGNFLYRI